MRQTITSERRRANRSDCAATERRDTTTHFARLSLALSAIAFCISLADAAENDAPAADRQRLASRAGAIERTSEPSSPDCPQITVAGTVMNEEERPVPSAHIVLRAKGLPALSPALAHNHDVLARTQADKAGRFRFEHIALPPRIAAALLGSAAQRGNAGLEIVAFADDLGLARHDVSLALDESNLRLILPTPATVEGVVHNKAGAPLAGATVILAGATRAAPHPDATLAGRRDLNLAFSDLEFSAESDASGHFSLAHVPSDCCVLLEVRLPGCRTSPSGGQRFFVDTSLGATVREVILPGEGRTKMPVLLAPVELTLDAPRVSVVRVRSAGAPVKSGGVQVIDAAGQIAGAGMLDADGLTRIPIAGAGEYTFVYESDPFAPLLGGRAKKEIGAHEVTAAVEIDLPPQRIVAGRVEDVENSVGIPGVFVRYVAEAEEHTHTVTVISDAEGAIHVPVIAGAGKLHLAVPLCGFWQPTFATAAMPRSDAPKPANDVPVEIPATENFELPAVRVSRGLIVRGLLRDAAGQPVAGAIVRGSSGYPLQSHAIARTDAQGKFTLSGLAPNAAVIVTAASPAGAARREVPLDPSRSDGKSRTVEIELTAEPLPIFTGRVLKDAWPLPGVLVRLTTQLSENSIESAVCAETRTDEEGRFEVSGVAPGERYWIELDAGDGSVATNWVHQFPYIQTVPSNMMRVELPDAALIECRQTLAGRIVDREGNPVSDVHLQVNPRGGGVIPGRDRLQQTVNEKGEFTLSNLPDQDIELMFWNASPHTNRIYFPSRLHPRRNQQDIRVVFDPTLNEDVEDLDAVATPARRVQSSPPKESP